MSWQDALKKITSKFYERRKYMRGNKGGMEEKYQELKSSRPNTKKGKISRKAGLVGIDIAWFLFCIGKFGWKDLKKGASKIFWDNKIIDEFKSQKEKIAIKTNDSKFNKFFKNLQKSNPVAASRLQLWMIYTLFTLLVIGGVKLAKHKNNDNEVKTEQQQQKISREIDDLKIDPTLDKQEWDKQMDEIWPYLYMETILSEGFVGEAYADVGNSSGYLTIGSGFMIGKANPKTKMDYAIIKERKAFFKKVLGKPYVNGVTISYDENRILVHEFYKQYIFPQIKQAFTTPIDAHLFIELCIGSYNRGAGIYNAQGKDIKEAINAGDSLENIVNKFVDFHTPGNDGLFPKYGIAAHRALGHISDVDVLDASANSVYSFSEQDLWQDGKLKPYENVAQDLKGFVDLVVKKNGKTYNQHKVREYLYPEEIDIITRGGLFDTTAILSEQIQTNQETIAEQLNEQAETLLDSGDYKAALEKFYEVLNMNPNMHIVYSNLSLVYYKLGQYENGVNIVRDFIKSQYFASAPAAVKGYTYYNVALNYEKLGDSAKDDKQKIEYYNRAQKNIEIGEKVAKTKYYTLDNRINTKLSELTNTKQKVFDKGTQKIKSKQNNKRVNLTKSKGRS